MSYFRYSDWGDNPKLLSGMQRAYDKSYSALKSTKWAKYRRAYLYLHSMHNIDDVPAALRAVGKEYFLQSQLFRPVFARQVLSTIPRLKDALHGQDPPWRVEPFLLTDAPEVEATAWEQAARYQEYLEYQLVKQLYWRELLDPLLFDAMLYEQAVVRLGYVQRSEPKWKVEESVGGRGEMQLAPELEPQVTDLANVQAWGVVEERVRAEVVSPFQWLPDVEGRSIRGRHDNQPCRFVQETSGADIEEMIAAILADPLGGWEYPEDADIGKDTAEVAAAAGGPTPDPSAIGELEKRVRKWLSRHEGTANTQEDYGRKLATEVGKLGGRPSQADTEDGGRLPLLTFWGSGPDPWYIVRVGGPGGDILCKRRREQHPSIFAPIPYIVFAPMRLANELYGFGLISLLDKLQRELNAWTNVTLTSYREAMNGITLVNKGLGMTPEMIRGVVDRVIGVTNPGGLPLTDFVQHIERHIPDLGAALNMLEMLMDEANTTGGISEVLQGSSAMKGTPVRSYALAVDQGSKRMDSAADNLGNRAGELGEVLHGINRQYLLKARAFQKVGETGPSSILPITTAHAQRQYEIAFNCKPVVVNEALQLQNHVSFVTVNGGAEEFNRAEAIIDHAKLLDMPNPERYVKVHPKDADMENEFFTRNGHFPWPAQRDDDDEYHYQCHQQVSGWADAQEQQGNPMPKMQLQMHLQTHALPPQMRGPGGVAPGGAGMPGAGAPGLPSMPGGLPGAPAAGPTMPPVAPMQGANRSGR